jgi:cell division protein FtsL
MDSLLNKLIYEISLVDLTKEQANRINPLIEKLERQEKMKDGLIGEYEKERKNLSKINKHLVISYIILCLLVLVSIILN